MEILNKLNKEVTGNINLPNFKELATGLVDKFGEECYQQSLDNHILLFSSANLLEKLGLLKDEFAFNMLLDICGVDNLLRPVEEWPHGKRYEAVYHLLNMQSHQRVRVRVALAEGEEIPSCMALWQGADWFEREAWDMLGITFAGRKKERLLTHHEFVGHPLRKDYSATDNQPLSANEEIFFPEDSSVTEEQKSAREWVNIGPSHPATHGTLRVMCELEGETIKRSKLEIGYLHRCFEKMCENHLYNQVIPYTDRLNYCSSPMNNIGWCKAVEDYMGIEIPDRAKALRMVLAELSRVIDHLVCIGTAAVDIGALTNFWFCFEQRERVYELFEKLCGARLTVSLTRIGGMSHELPPGWVSDCLETVAIIKKNVETISTMLSRSKIWMDRTKVCAVSAQDAISWGYTGPCLRASGVNYDLRKNSPYYFYNDVEFEIPLGINGDGYDRYLVRMEEMRQSLSIVGQVLDNLPSGPIVVLDKSISLPNKKEVYTNIEGLMNHFMLVMKGITPKVGDYYSSTEAANGELGFYIIADGSKHPYRVKVRPPCFAIYQSFSHVIQDNMLADAVATLGSFNVIAGELDR